ncbi:MAG: uroporphyrinogen decarboxylase [Oscillochloris sp.]|nr:uroporphyrinogen decarboxylase [Oscillochloris sp.]
MLSKHDLLLATIARKPTPRTPIALWRHWPAEDQVAEDLARATLDFQRRFDFDFIKLTPSQIFVAEDAGLTGTYEGNPEGDLLKGPRPITSLDQWEALRPQSLQSGALARQLRCLDLVIAGAADTPVIQTIFNPLTVAACLAGDRATIWRRRYPDAFQHGFNAIIETWRGFVGAVIKAGAAGIFFSTADASYRSMSEEEYLRWGRPSDLEILDAAGAGWLNVLHVHGDDLMFNLVSDYPAQVVNWDDRRAGPSLREGQSLVRKAVAGGLAQWGTLLSGSVDEVRAQVSDGIAQTGGIGYIVAAGCVTPIPTPERNIRAAISAACGE